MCISPKLGDLAWKESTEEAKGLLLGEGMVNSREIESTFTTLEKAQN